MKEKRNRNTIRTKGEVNIKNRNIREQKKKKKRGEEGNENKKEQSKKNNFRHRKSLENSNRK